MSEHALADASGQARRGRAGWAVWLAENVVSIQWSVAAVALALAAGGLLMTISGASALDAYQALFEGALGNPTAIGATLTFAAPLILVGAGTALAFRSRVFNIGGEGQIYLGALGASLAGLFLPAALGPAHLVLALCAGVLFGGAWALVAGAIRVFRGPHEVVVTLLLNFVGVLLVQYLVQGPLLESGHGFPVSKEMPDSAALPTLWSAGSLHFGIVLAVACALLIHALVWRTPLGFATRCLGQGERVAHYAGVSPRATFLAVIAISGALAGLAGAVQTLGTYERLQFEVSDGLGFDGIAVALIARLSALGAIIAGTFFGFLRAGAVPMQLVAGVPASLVIVIQGLAILFIVAGAGVSARVRFARGARRARRLLAQRVREAQ